MTLEIQVLAWDRHNNVTGLNQLNLQWSQCSLESTHQIVIDEKYSIRHQIENLQQFKSEITC